jgi:hypothetical protein
MKNIRSVVQDFASNGFSFKDMRWVMFFKVYGDNSHLYGYLNDNHIDTALRRITETN